MAIQNRTMREGLVVGLIGYTAVAGFYAAFDFLASRGALFTVNLLGRVVFRGLRDPAVLQLPVQIDPTAVVMYTGLHLGVSLAIGVMVAWLVSQADGPPRQARLALITIVAGFETSVSGEQLHFSYLLKEGVSNDRLGYLILKKEGVVDMLEKL